MKKISFILTVLTLFSCISILTSSCKKSTSSETKPVAAKGISVAELDAELNQINSKFLHKDNIGKKATAASGNSSKVIVTAVADIVGAATTGKTVCPGLASFGLVGIYAGLFLTAAGGALASYGTYKMMSSSVAAPNPFGNGNGGDGNTSGNINLIHEENQLIQNVGTYQVPNPYNNPYDATGAEHNQLVKMLCQKPQDVSLTQSTLRFDASDLTSDQLNYIALDGDHLVYNFGTFLGYSSSYVDANGNFTIAPMMTYSLSSDQVLSTAVTDLVNGLYQTTDLSSGISLLNAYENYFLSNPTCLTADQQSVILNALSVGKYSLTMWTDAFSVDN